jgi:F-type H+-transporting ATPase subunit delta
MSKLIAKKYVSGLMKAISNDEMPLFLSELEKLSVALEDERVYQILTSPSVAKSDKEKFILSFKNNNDKKYENFIKLLSEKNRFLVIPYIFEELKNQETLIKNEYVGNLYSNEEISNQEIQALEANFSKKFNSSIKLNFEKQDVDGIKVDIESLGVEIGFSRQRVQAAMLEHILKAI